MLDQRYMERCLALAEKAWPACRPNPMVGAVLVLDDKVIGEGYTQAYGGSHAEVMALKGTEGMDLGKATLYVSLEPCAHRGKTPPCADLIIARGVGEVSIACRDPFHEVAGKGIEKLMAAGISLEYGLMEKEARFLNRRFFTFHEKRRPYIVLKWARSKDGFIDGKDSGRGKKLTSILADQYVHCWRSEEMAILVGGETYRKDQPGLECRLVDGPDPIPLIWSEKFQQKDLQEKHLRKALIMRGKGLKEMLQECYEKGIQSILVEGGMMVLEQFLQEGFYDEVRMITTPVKLGTGISEPMWDSEGSEQIWLEEDLLEHKFQGS